MCWLDCAAVQVVDEQVPASKLLDWGGGVPGTWALGVGASSMHASCQPGPGHVQH
jgi:hypothetical protein